MLRFACPGSVAVNWPFPSAVMGTVFRTSPNAFMFSMKYSTCGLESEAELENEQVIFTCCVARIIAAPSDTWVTRYSVITGLGRLRETRFAAPGVGRSAKVKRPFAGRTATQFAGSFEGAVAL